MDIRIATEEERDFWDELVASSPSGTLFHTWDWLKLMEKHAEKKVLFNRYRPKLIPIVVEAKGTIIGLFPVFLYKFPFLNIVASPPFAVENFYLGPILCESKATHFHTQLLTVEFYKCLDEFVRTTLGARYVSLHLSPGMEDSRPLRWRGYQVQPSFTYQLDLSVGKASLFSNLSHNVQKNIKKAERLELVIEETDGKGLHHLYRMLKDAGRIHAKEEFLIEIMERFSPENARIFMVKKEDIFLSGLMIISYKNKAAWWIGCPACSYDGINPNEVALWKSIEWAVDNGYDYFELMGADDQNLFFFKSKFNGALVPLFIAKWYSPMMRVYRWLFRWNNSG